MSDNNNGGTWEWLRTVVYAVLIAVFIRAVAYEPFNIPSSSMEPTLLVGDYLFVSKFSYGYSRYSMPLSLPLIPGRIFVTPPEQGDVAVFKLPSDNSTDYIKRIIGLPGDRLQMKRGRLYINGTLVERRRVDDYLITDSSGHYRRVAQFEETLPNGRKHRILEMTDKGALDNTPVFTVPPGYYFAMGDNRDNSSDSRVPAGRGGNGVGFIPIKNMIGRAEMLFFSTDGTARIWQIWRWPLATRFNRFFKAVD